MADMNKGDIVKVKINNGKVTEVVSVTPKS